MKDDTVYIAHILACIRKIEDYTGGGRQAFMSDEMIQDAVMRNLEVIGEAAGKVSPELRRAHPEVGWRGAMELRNVLIHNYMGVDVSRVWGVVTGKLPKLKADISAITAAQEPPA